MKQRSGQKIKLTSVEELLGVPSDKEAPVDVELAKIRSFRNHPFKVVDDDKMLDLIGSIRDNGILTPVLIRPMENGMYEMISGHRRMHAASRLKMNKIPAIIREMSDDEAVLVMVDSNIQREELLPSEKAFAYKMKLESMKRQGARSDLTSSHFETKLRSDSKLSQEIGESRAQIQRYIRLTELIPKLLDLVDKKRLSFTVGVDISYIDKEIQEWIYQYVFANGMITPQQVRTLRKALESGSMTQKKMIGILNDCIKPKTTSRKVTLSERKLREYFTEDYTSAQMERIVLELLEKWKKERN